MSRRLLRIFAAVAATVFFLSSGAATAAPPVKMPMAPPTAQTATPSKKEIHEFAQVYVKVASIRNDYRKKLSATKDQAKAQQLRKRGAKELDSAVADSPLGIERYNQIAHAVSSDNGLKQQVIAQIKQIRNSR